MPRLLRVERKGRAHYRVFVRGTKEVWHVWSNHIVWYGQTEGYPFKKVTAKDFESLKYNIRHEIDTSDIPETKREWFENARLKLPTGENK